MRPSRSTKLGMMPPFCFIRASQASMYSTIHARYFASPVSKIGVGRQRRRDEVEEVVADDVGVFLVVLEELLRYVLSPCRATKPVASNGSPTQSSAVALRSIGPRLPLIIVRISFLSGS